MAPTVFVCGATGSQGGAVARQLLDLNWNVHAIVRNIASTGAKSLEKAGARLIEGDWDNTKALRASMSGCDRVFLCLLPNFTDLGSELRQTESILNIAKFAGVKQVVASSSLGVSQLENKVHFNEGSFMKAHLTRKKAIEQAVINYNFDHYTLLRVAFMMANFIEPKVNRYAEVRDKGTWTTCMTTSTLLPLIDHEDIGRFAVAAFQSPDEFDGQKFGIASQLLTVQETLDQISDAVGKPKRLKAVFMSDEEVEALEGSTRLMNGEKAMRTISNYVNMEHLRSVIPLTAFKEFLERENEDLKNTFRELTCQFLKKLHRYSMGLCI